MSSSPFLLRTLVDGTREISWRVWVLVWVLPVCFLGGALCVALYTAYLQSVTEVTTGTVVKVYDWPNDGPQIFYPGDKVYSPVYGYVWSDGTETEATAGTSHTQWNFPVGSEHQIRFHPDRKDDVILVGPTEWLVAKVVGLIGICLAPLALLITVRLRRWQRSGHRLAVDTN
ncbi:MAG: DUF3592 domain-containing protein [Pseudomonadota bacterium]